MQRQLRSNSSSSLVGSILLLVSLLGVFFSVFFWLRPSGEPSIGKAYEPQDQASLVKRRAIESSELKSAPSRPSIDSVVPPSGALAQASESSAKSGGEAKEQSEDEAIQSAREAIDTAKDPGLARDILEAVLAKNPEQIDAAQNLFFVYEHLEDLAGAKERLKKLEASLGEGAKPGLNYILGRLMVESGEVEEGKQRLEQVVAAGVDDPYVREQLAVAYVRSGDGAHARETWRALAEDEVPSQASFNAKAKLAELLLSEGKVDEAKAKLEDILSQDPSNPFALTVWERLKRRVQRS